MTKLFFVEHGVEKKVGNECSNCAHHLPVLGRVFLVCCNERSKDYCHILWPTHPACEEFEEC